MLRKKLQNLQTFQNKIIRGSTHRKHRPFWIRFFFLIFSVLKRVNKKITFFFLFTPYPSTPGCRSFAVFSMTFYLEQPVFSFPCYSLDVISWQHLGSSSIYQGTSWSPQHHSFHHHRYFSSATLFTLKTLYFLFSLSLLSKNYQDMIFSTSKGTTFAKISSIQSFSNF